MKNQLPIEVIEATKPLEIIINGTHCIEVSHQDFIVYAQDNPFPFLNASYNNIHKHWTYKSLSINGKFYAPKFNQNK